MRYLRRLIAVLACCATWFLATSSAAFAMIVDDPGPAGPPVITDSSGTPIWELLGLVGLGVLVVVAIVGLGQALSRPRRSEPSPR
jgi:hypothetical protein